MEFSFRSLRICKEDKKKTRIGKLVITIAEITNSPHPPPENRVQKARELYNKYVTARSSQSTNLAHIIE